MVIKMSQRQKDLIDMIWPYVGEDGCVRDDAPIEIKNALKELEQYEMNDYYQ